MERIEIRETPDMTLADVTRSHTTCLEAVLWNSQPVKEKIKELIHRSRGFQLALEGLMVQYEQSATE